MKFQTEFYRPNYGYLVCYYFCVLGQAPSHCPYKFNE